jgi:hypothetical protein
MRDSAATTLNVIVEWEVTVWLGLNVAGWALTSRGEFADAWEAHGELLLPAYIAAMPGSRPFALYVIGEIPMPPIIEAPRQYGRRRQIDGVVFHESSTYGIGDEPELEHLVGLGIVDAREARAARKRINEHGSRSRYDFISPGEGSEDGVEWAEPEGD